MGKRAFFYFYSAIFVVTPSLVFTNLVEAFELPKLFFLITIFSLFSIYSLLKLKSTKINVLDIILLVFLIAYLLSSLLSLFPFASFFGLPYVYSESFIYVLALFSFLVFSKEGFKHISYSDLYTLVILGSIPVIIYSILQIFGLDPVLWADTTSRTFSTFGQPNLLGMYLGVCLFSSLWFFLEKGVRKYILLVLLYLVIIFTTLSLGSLFSFVFSLTLLVVLRINKLNKKNLTIFVILAGLSLVFFISPIFSRVISQMSGGNFNGVYKTEDTAKVRLILYKSTLSQYVNDPKIFGFGPENYLFSYQRPNSLNKTSNWKTDFIKPHNFFIEELFEVGIAGFLFYSFIFITSLAFIRKDYMFVVPVFIFTNSLFFWPGVFNYFILLIFYYYAVVNNKSFLSKRIYTLNYKKNLKIVFMLFFTLLLFINIMWFSSVVLLKKNPCLSLQLFYSSEYQIVCLNTNPNLNEPILNFNSYYYYYRYAQLLLEQGNPLCKQYFERILYLNNPKYYYGYGKCLEVLGEKEGALEYYNKALQDVTDFYQAKESQQKILSID